MIGLSDQRNLPVRKHPIMEKSLCFFLIRLYKLIVSDGKQEIRSNLQIRYQVILGKYLFVFGQEASCDLKVHCQFTIGYNSLLHDPSG